MGKSWLWIRESPEPVGICLVDQKLFNFSSVIYVEYQKLWDGIALMCLTQQCCYITVDSGTTALQNGACTAHIGAFPNKRTIKHHFPTTAT